MEENLSFYGLLSYVLPGIKPLAIIEQQAGVKQLLTRTSKPLIAPMYLVIYNDSQYRVANFSDHK